MASIQCVLPFLTRHIWLWNSAAGICLFSSEFAAISTSERRVKVVLAIRTRNFGYQHDVSFLCSALIGCKIANFSGRCDPRFVDSVSLVSSSGCNYSKNGGAKSG